LAPGRSAVAPVRFSFAIYAEVELQLAGAPAPRLDLRHRVAPRGRD
jgi:hypothetical protein